MRQAADVRPYVAVWNEVEWRFHEALTAAADSVVLRQTHANLFDRYRQHLVTERNGFGFRRGVVREHKAILDAALARNAALCRQRIHDHILAGMSAGARRTLSSAAE